MGLPQELVDYIMDILYSDLHTLKACSLTCKSMFVSTRHLIHQTLHLTPRNNQSILTREEKPRYQGQDYHDVELRFLSFMGERGLLRYVQYLHIRMFLGTFTPDTLLPHIHHFQSLDRVHTITIDHYDTVKWATHHDTCFVHFYPTLTTLTLRRPLGHYRLVLQFALQFPNLDNLSLEWMEGKHTQSGVAVPAIVGQFPPLCGNLRLAGLDDGAIHWPINFAHDIRNKVNFRSVELEGSLGDNAQYILNACAGTIENLTLVPRGFGASHFFPFGMEE
jgi:hypothetical protein